MRRRRRQRRCVERSGKRRDAARSATLLNAAAAIYVGSAADTMERAVRLAADAISSGAALQKLEALKAATGR